MLTTLKGNGDFRSKECIEYLKQSDIVVTNPPFSLFREYIKQLIKHDKKFLIIGNIHTISTMGIFPLFKENKTWLGQNRCLEFLISNKEKVKIGSDRWFTNLKIEFKRKPLNLNKKYSNSNYPKYDNYDAINVDKVKEIPIDYKEEMGVPITYLDYHNPKKFKIIGSCKIVLKEINNKDSNFILNKKNIYSRIVIKKVVS